MAYPLKERARNALLGMAMVLPASVGSYVCNKHMHAEHMEELHASLTRGSYPSPQACTWKQVAYAPGPKKFTALPTDKARQCGQALQAVGVLQMTEEGTILPPSTTSPRYLPQLDPVHHDGYVFACGAVSLKEVVAATPNKGAKHTEETVVVHETITIDPAMKEALAQCGIEFPKEEERTASWRMVQIAEKVWDVFPVEKP